MSDLRTYTFLRRSIALGMISGMSVEVHHLKNAPIEEAMIAFDFTLSVDSPSVFLGEVFGRMIQAKYPTSTNVTETEMVVGANITSESSTSVVGSRFVSSDGKNVCTILRRSFICSRLRPYETWHALHAEFRDLWAKFSETFGATAVKVAVRYINKLSIPVGAEIHDYVNTFPKMAVGLPKDTQNVWVRVEMPIEDPPGLLTVTEVQLPLSAADAKLIDFVLDHDLQFPLAAGQDPWATLSEARRLKNQYFFASISSKLEEQFR